VAFLWRKFRGIKIKKEEDRKPMANRPLLSTRKNRELK
jgi:hypothetical protein